MKRHTKNRDFSLNSQVTGNNTMKLFLAMLLFVSLVLTSSLVQATQDPKASYPCDSKCGKRCALAGRQDRCLKYCKICCGKCKCVPSGTVGNKSQCPCYRDMLNSKGTSKCP